MPTPPTNSPLKPWTLAELQAELSVRSSRGEKIVFTNGVFDLVHPGHVRYLRGARELGDLLVIGVNTDSSVRRLKGPQRPILSQGERVKILSAFEFVDYVILFDEDTPLETITAIRPNVLVKGADYGLDEIVGRREVESWGGTVMTVELVPGVSTSDIVARIVEAQKLA